MNWNACLLLIAATASAADYDVAIRGGRVIDGTGAPAAFADIAIRGGAIAFVGKLPGDATATTTVNLTNCWVTPGFIDVHTHAENILELPEAENFTRMGVTTLVLGNCGSSALSVANFFEEFTAKKAAVNIATLIGHNTVRRKAMGGNLDRPPTESELGEMRQLLRAAMDDGALGLSTGLIYLPGVFSQTGEIIELARVAASRGGLYASHMRDEGLGIEGAIDELIQIARQARIRAHISHIKLSGRSAWGRAPQILALIEAARAEGLDISQDQYAYTASSTGIAQLVPESAREGGKFAERAANPDTRASIIAQMKASLARRGQTDYAYAVIALYEPDPSLNGLNIPDAAMKKRGSADLDTQIGLILEIVGNGGASGVFHGMSEGDLRVFMTHPNTMFASDSAVRAYNEGVPHPRGYGNNARVLSRYVRDAALLRPEEAVRRMTSLPAAVFNLKSRGQIAPGFAADLAIIDPAQIGDRATYLDPHQYAAGILHLMVNGEWVIQDATPTPHLPGRPLKRGQE